MEFYYRNCEYDEKVKKKLLLYQILMQKMNTIIVQKIYHLFFVFEVDKTKSFSTQNGVNESSLH